MSKNLIDILVKKVSKVPDASSLVFVVDPKPLLGELSTQLADLDDRLWKVYRYDGNDLELRIRCKQTALKKEKLIVHAVPRKGIQYNAKPIVFSFIADLLQSANEIIDFSPHRILSELSSIPFPPDLYEEPLLGMWSQDIAQFLKNIDKYRKLSGKQQVLDRYDAFAIVLATIYPDLIAIEELCHLPFNPIDRAEMYLRNVFTNQFNDDARKLFNVVIAGSEAESSIKNWIQLSLPSLRRIGYSYLAAKRYLIPSPLVMVRGLSLLDVDTKGMDNEIEATLSSFNRDPLLLKNLTELIENEFSPEEIFELAKQFRFGSKQDYIESLGKEPSPLLSIGIAKRFLAENLNIADVSTSFAKLDLSPIENREINLAKTNQSGLCEKVLSLLTKIIWLEKSLASLSDLKEKSIRAIVDHYYINGLYLFDLTLAEISDLNRQWKDSIIQSKIEEYVSQRKITIEIILQTLDEVLAATITQDWNGYTSYPRLITKVLRDTLQPGQPRKDKVWIIVFDGMRLDTWQSTIWPALSQHFKIEGEFNLYVSALPSHTEISRVAFFAGHIPIHWKDYSNNRTTNHSILLSRLLGLSKEESRTKLQVIARTEEKIEQQELDLDRFQYTALIFNISDNWIHNEKGSLIRVNEIIKQKLESLVIPELESRIKAGDTIVISSDHGFIELRDEHKVVVDDNRNWNDYKNDYESPVYYRYLHNIENSKGKKIQYESSEFWTLPVGFTWFDRPKGKPSRYSHGGISLSEMVVPGIKLSKLGEKQASLEMMIDPVPECSEGDEITLIIRLLNKGTMAIDSEVSVYASGKSIFRNGVQIPIGKDVNVKVPMKASPMTSSIEVDVGFYDHTKTLQRKKRVIQIAIKESDKIKIDTSALDVFDIK